MKRSNPLPLAILLAAFAASSACGPSTPQFVVQQPVLKAKIGNGLRLVIIPDKTTPMVQVDVRYEIGSNEDPTDKAGLAHLVEHMMFQHRFGDESVPVEQRPPTFEILSQLGVTGMNAYTNWDQTHYWLQARKEDLPKLLQLEAARMQMGCKTIQESEFQREREVVRNEIRQRMGTALGKMIIDVEREAYPEGHPYEEMIGGDDANLSNITMDDVCKFMKDHYVPSNATVVVAGNVNHDEVGKLVNGLFGSIDPGTPAKREPPAAIEIVGRKVTKEYDIERTIVNVLWAMPPHYTPEHDNASFMQYALGSIAGNLGETYDVCTYQGVQQLGGNRAPVMWLSLEMKPGKSIGDCLDFVWKAAAMTPRFFEDLDDYDSEARQKSLRKQAFVEAMEPLAARTGFVADAVQFDRRVSFTGEDNYFYKHLDRIDTLSPGPFKSYARKMLSKKKALVFIAKANKEGTKGDSRSTLKYSAKSHDKKPDPVIDPATANTPLGVPNTDSILVTAERYTLGNGMKIVLLPYEGLPVVKGRLMFKTGAVFEASSKAGLADVAADLSLPPGSTAVRAAGVRVGGSGGMETTTFFSAGINIYLNEVIHAVERIVKVGRISQEGIEEYRKHFKDRFKRPSYQREWVYQMEFAGAMYGKDHPYTLKGSPTPKSLGEIGKDNALSFGRKHYSAKNATFILVGNFDPAKAKSIISDSLGDWGGGHLDPAISVATPNRSGPEYIGVVDKEGAPQMRVGIAYPSASGIDSQEGARLVLAEMLKIRMGTVRAQLGSTYGISAGRTQSVGPNVYRIGGNVDAQRAGETLKFIRLKIQEFRDGVDFDRDFVTARFNILKKLVAESTESNALAGRLSKIARYDLDPDYYDKLARTVASVLPKQVKAIMALELDPKKEIIVTLGDRATLDAAFAEAGLDNVRIVDPAIK